MATRAELTARYNAAKEAGDVELANSIVAEARALMASE